MSKEKIPRQDFLLAEPVAIDSRKRTFTFSKDSTMASRQSLRVKVRMTYAGLRTKNRAIYLPDEHYKSAHTFLTPYNKPVQVHHQDHIDPIGRVIDVRYVDTTAAAALVDKRVKDSLVRMRDERASITDKLNSGALFLELSQNPHYKGVGHILGLWDVSDPDAIQKLLDGRYLTVSTGMMPQHAFCSTCAREDVVTDWAVDFCEHDRGRIYDGVECVAIPTDYEWEEVSPVNHPAAPLSQVIEVGHGLSLMETSSTDIRETGPQEVFEDFYLLTEGSDTALRFRDGQEMTVPTLDHSEHLETSAMLTDMADNPEATEGSGTALQLRGRESIKTPKSNNEKDSPKNNDKSNRRVRSSQKRKSRPSKEVLKVKKLNQNSELSSDISENNNVDSVIGEKRIPDMEVTGTMAHELTVLSEDTISNYKAIAEHLTDGILSLTSEELESLDDSVFIGPNRTFPVVDSNHVSAIRALLEKIEDSDAKSTLVSFLDEQEENINNTEVTEDDTTEGSANTESNEESNNETTEEASNTEVTETTDTENTEGETTVVPVEELEALRVTSDEHTKVTLDRDLWKARASRLQDEVRHLTVANTSLLKEQKQLLAEGLIDAQSNRGFLIEDIVATTATYTGRSIQSLKDSLEDLTNKKIEGTSRIPSGERVADPRLVDSTDEEISEIQDAEQTTSEYNGILERYWNLYYGPGGHKAANTFLDSVKRDGIVPPTLQP